MNDSPTIILIDDDEISNFILKKRINNYNSDFQIKSFVDGKKALDYLQSNNNIPHAIFTDLNMPVMDGLQFVKEYSKLRNKTDKLIFMVTGIGVNKEVLEKYNILATYKKPITAQIIKEILK